MGERINNMNKMIQDPKQRNMYLTLVALAVVALGTGFWFVSKTSKVNQVPSGAAVATVPVVQSSPGTSTNPEYNQKVQESNKARADVALQSGTTSLPVLTNSANLSDQSPLDLVNKGEGQAQAVQTPVQPEYTPNPPVAVAVPVLAPEPVAVQVSAPAPAAKKYGSNDDYMLLNTLSGAWKVKSSSAEFDYARVKESTLNNGNQSVNNANNSGQVSGVSQQAQNSIPLAKSGTIFNAILETGINSDEPSPVLAKVVSGDLKGARLIGSIRTVGEKVVVEFSSISLPNAHSSMKLSAVAIDINSSRTALASDVDNHYFKKYGLMMAAAFLGGYANALGRQNTTTIVDPLGGATIVQGELSTKDINRQAIGSVGKDLAETVRADTQGLKPTITVNQGIAIGILLMDDLIVR